MRETGTGQQVAQLRERLMMMVYKTGQLIMNGGLIMNGKSGTGSKGRISENIPL